MPNLVTKSNEYQAVRWTGQVIEGGAPDWIHDALMKPSPDTRGGIMRMGAEVHVGTREGVMIAKAGDWILRLEDDDLAVVPAPVAQLLFDVPAVAQLGRFGHHSDPASDFCIEVESIEGYQHDAERGFGGKTIDVAFYERICTAMDFVVGGDPRAVSAKAALRDIQADVKLGLVDIGAAR